ncbi:tetratricopeptide repeat protein [Algoriphagus sp.]|uniref:tetratricopeptide repeat protein n=1 Tax=Algoriphagus sp. TaxID=1872435 RepID=UPI002601BDCF|nr:tetratricopeptide repeat protein [Algoriphagus sp.]
MKKLILSLALVAVTAIAFGQKKVVRSANKNFKSGDLEAALTDINMAIEDPETGAEPETYLLKAQIELKMFGSDSTQNEENLKLGEASLATFFKTFEMAGSNKEEGVGKDVYAEDVTGVPDNLRPYSIMTLKNTSFDKAIRSYENEDLEMAYEYFNLAGEIDPRDTTIHYNAGFLANEIGRTEEAKKHFNLLFEIPEYNKINAYYTMIQISSAEEDSEGAYELVKNAREEYPEDKVLAEYEIQLLLQLNKMDEAMAQINEALKNDPENTAILLRSGYLKEQSGDIEGALADYKKSVEIDSEFYEGNYYTGALLLEMAKEVMTELNALSDEEWEKRSDEMGAKINGYYEDAVPYFEKSLEIRPEDTDVMAILFQIHSRLKNAEEAEKYNQKLIELLGPNWMEG